MHSFRKAAVSTLALVLAVLLLLLIAAAPYFYADEQWWQDAADRRTYAGELTTLMCGSSQGYRAFVPELYDELRGGSSYNLGCSFMTMYGSYDMLKKELARNPADTVILEVCYDALTRNRDHEGPEGDIYQLGRCDGIGEAARYFFSALRPKEYAKVCYYLINRGLSGWKELLRTRFHTGHPTTKVWGEFDAVDLRLTAEEAQELKDSYGSTPINTVIYPENSEYFEKCFEMSFEKGARVIIVLTPLPDTYLLSHSEFDVPLQWYRDYAEKYGCELYDFNLLRERKELYPEDTAYSDNWHLSASGADTFTRQLAEFLDAADREEDISTLFYNNYLEATEAAFADYGIQ